MALLRARLEIEQQSQTALKDLGRKYPEGDFDSVYADRDLIDTAGIAAARVRLAACSAMTEELNAINNQRLTAVAELYATNKLAEPFGLQVRETIAKSEPRLRARYSASLQAMRANVEAIKKIFDFAEKQIGNTRLEADHLAFNSSDATLQYARLKQQEADTQRRNQSATDEALSANDGVTAVLREILMR